jgi:RHS repeat-associated protein
MLGVTDTVSGTLVGAQPDSYFHRDYKYDAFLRPWSITTHVPAETGAWAAQDLTIEYGYGRNYGRMKAMSSPSQTQELVRFDYDRRGIAIGETPLGPDGNPPTGANPYRQVVSMSVRGQVTEQLFGNHVDETLTSDDATGLPTSIVADGLHEPSTACPAASTPMVRHLTYLYDHFLNLASQQREAYQRDANGLVFTGCAPITVTALETYDYDELQRLTQTSRSWTNLSPDAAAAVPTQYAYDDLGNIRTKSDYAQTYSYPPSGATTYATPGPHAVTSLSNGMTFTYDANGNLTGSTGVDARTVTFDNLDRPIQIVKGTTITIFRYAPDGGRYVQRTTSDASPYPKTVFYVDKLFERVVWNGVTEEKTYVGPETVIYRNGTIRDIRYLSLDRLGSVEAVTTSSAAEYVVDQHSFDAFGKPRKGDFTTGIARLHSSDYNVTTEHGFTGHEHLDETYLIHMNGRVYDYRLGRFLSVDPVVSNPASSQSLNPYSYIGNNPLSGVDPTGYVPAGAQCAGTSWTNSDGTSACINASDIPNVTSSALISGVTANYYAGPSDNSARGSNGATPTGIGRSSENPSDHGSLQSTATQGTEPTAAAGKSSPEQIATQDERERAQVRDQSLRLIHDPTFKTGLRQELESGRPYDVHGKEQGTTFFETEGHAIYYQRWPDDDAERLSIRIPILGEDGRRIFTVPARQGQPSYEVETNDPIVASSHMHPAVGMDRFTPNEPNVLSAEDKQFMGSSRQSQAIGPMHFIVSPYVIIVVYPGRHPAEPQHFILGRTDDLLKK